MDKLDVMYLVAKRKLDDLLGRVSTPPLFTLVGAGESVKFHASSPEEARYIGRQIARRLNVRVTVS